MNEKTRILIILFSLILITLANPTTMISQENQLPDTNNKAKNTITLIEAFQWVFILINNGWEYCAD